MKQEVQPVQLRPETLDSFTTYIAQAELEMKKTECEDNVFLWAYVASDRMQEIDSGTISAQCVSGSKPLPVPDGLIHDWIGVISVPATTVEQTLMLLQNYDNHKNIYQPEVIDSKLISRDGNNFRIHLRLLKKKIKTVVLDTDHDVLYYSPADGYWCCRSYTTRIAEVEHCGTANEKVLPPDSGFGFLWRLYSYWRLREHGSVLYVVCRAISLTRDIPKGLGWIIRPIIKSLPEESLAHTLDSTRRALTLDRKQHDVSEHETHATAELTHPGA